MPLESARWTVILLLLVALAPLNMVNALAVGHGNSQQNPDPLVNILQTGSSPGLNLTLNTPSVTMGLGEDAIVALTITGVNDFNDTVALSSSMAPNSPLTTGDGFSGSFSKDVFRISPGNPTLRVNVTVEAYTLPPFLPAYPQLGSYTITVFATGQTPPLYVASTQMQVNVQPYAPPTPKLLFELGYNGPASPSATIQLDSNFTDIGNVQLVVTGLGFSGDFGSFNEPVGLPLSIYPGEKKSLSLNLTISSGMSLGLHRISSMSTWDYYVPNYYDASGNNFHPGSWTTGNAIVVNGSIVVAANIHSLFGPLASALSLAFRNPAVPLGVIIYAILVTLASILIIRKDHRKAGKLARTPTSISRTSVFMLGTPF
jgi:hypothetical protein